MPWAITGCPYRAKMAVGSGCLRGAGFYRRSGEHADQRVPHLQPSARRSSDGRPRVRRLRRAGEPMAPGGHHHSRNIPAMIIAQFFREPR